MIENEQQLAELIPAEPPEQTLATIVSIGTSGIVLDFGEKEYACNQGIKFVVGQRVLVEKRSGTYVVICPIGAPSTEVIADKAIYADSAGTAEMATAAQTATTAQSATTAQTADSATTAETAQTAESLQSATTSSQTIQLGVQSSKLYFRIGSSGSFQSSVSSSDTSDTADTADGVQSQTSSQVIEFSYSSGSLSFRLRGSSGWTKLQNA